MSGSDGRLPGGFTGDPAQLAQIAATYKSYFNAQARPQIDLPALQAHAAATSLASPCGGYQLAVPAGNSSVPTAAAAALACSYLDQPG